MLLPPLWLYYITFWLASKTIFSTLQGFAQVVTVFPTPKGEQGRGAARRTTPLFSLVCRRRRPVCAEPATVAIALRQGLQVPWNPAFTAGSVARANHGNAGGSRHALYRSHAGHGGRGKVGRAIGTEYPAQL